MKYQPKARLLLHCLRDYSALALFLLIAAAQAGAQAPQPKLTTIHQFVGGPSDGNAPLGAGSLVGGPGALVGMTNLGGAFKGGTVYTLVPPTAPGQRWAETILHNFAGGADGQGTEAVVTGALGVVYGTTFKGGTAGYGTAFSLMPPEQPGGEWSYTIIYNFQNREDPSGPLAVDSNGVIYGTSQTNGSLDYGVVYALYPPAAPGGAWTESVLHTFNGTDAVGPTGVVVGSGGVLYGTAASGVVYSLTPPTAQGGQWAYQALAYLTNNGHSSTPAAPPVIGAGGVLHGTIFDAPTPAGSIFSLTPPASDGGAWTFAHLYAFTYGELGSTDGSQPGSPLVIGPGGVLYGVTPYGGLNDSTGGSGTIFSLTPPATQGGAWTESVLYRFTTGTDGFFPGCVILSKQGILYGVSDEGIVDKAGSVWKFTQ
jgi:hypothetical protein